MCLKWSKAELDPGFFSPRVYQFGKLLQLKNKTKIKIVVSKSRTEPLKGICKWRVLFRGARLNFQTLLSLVQGFCPRNKTAVEEVISPKTY